MPRSLLFRLPRFFLLAAVLCLMNAGSLPAAEETASNFLKQNDLVAWVGGADVAAAAETGHLETLLQIAHPEKVLRFRNLGWEGDTVFEQPRDLNYPTLTEWLEKAGATVVLVQFGRSEALNGPEDLQRFEAAYRNLLRDITAITPRIVLITPPPFETSDPMKPDLSERNQALRGYAESIRNIGLDMDLLVIDLFGELEHQSGDGLTRDGYQLSRRGQARIAMALADRLAGKDVQIPMEEIGVDGSWSTPEVESVRQWVLQKNRLWFRYWRPQNWAFLGGDRTSQPSSRDHLNPEHRWFPEEMEEYPDLIQAAEERIHNAARQIQPATLF